MYAEANGILPNEEGLGAVDTRISAKLFAFLRQWRKGEALAIVKGIGDRRGVCARSRLIRKNNPQDHVRARQTVRASGTAATGEVCLWSRGRIRFLVRDVSKDGLGVSEQLSGAGQVACVTWMLPK